MKMTNEIEILKDSIVLMEKKLATKSLSTNKNREIEKSANETLTANNKLLFQYKERGELAAELIIANKELVFQYEEKEKRASELSIANIELKFQNEERKKRASELVIANKELKFQNQEKEKRAVELIIVIKELALQKLEIDIQASELIISNNKLFHTIQERKIKTAELYMVNRDLRNAEENQKEYIKGLEEMMFITSHKVRQPIANIVGFSSMLDEYITSPDELKQTIASIKESAVALDLFTRELTTFMCKLSEKEKK